MSGTGRHSQRGLEFDDAQLQVPGCRPNLIFGESKGDVLRGVPVGGHHLDGDRAIGTQVLGTEPGETFGGGIGWRVVSISISAS